MSEAWESEVAYWLVQKLKLARNTFQVVGVFSRKEDALAMVRQVDCKAEPAFLDGVRDFEQLVDVLICDRLWPLGTALIAQAKASREEIVARTVKASGESVSSDEIARKAGEEVQRALRSMRDSGMR